MTVPASEVRPLRRLRHAVIALAVVVAGVFLPVSGHGRAVAAQGSPSVVTDADLEAAGGGRTVQVGSTSTGQVVTLPLEVYVARVLAGEGEPRALDAAQQALAVAIRTFALANAGRHRRDGYDLCDSTHCQVLRAATAASRRATLATAGSVLAIDGTPAAVFYSASCGGRSESAAEVWPGADYPYLTSVPDDVHDGDRPWMLEMPLVRIEQALRRIGFQGERLRRVEVDARTVSGRVSRLRLDGFEPTAISGDQFRMALGPADVRSTAFTIERSGSGLRFTGRGYGHGVGMCVIGAGRRAMRGESFQRILGQYYPGLEVARIDRLTPVVAAAPAPALPLRGGTGGAVPRIAPPPRAAGITARVPAMSRISSAQLEQITAHAHDDLSRVIGASVAPITLELHRSLDSFRMATGRPWWVSAVAAGTTIDLAPASVLDQRDGLEGTVRVAVAELLTQASLAGRPAWVRVGAARYFAKAVALSVAAPSGPNAAAPAARCPSDAELTLAVSAVAQREAEERAERCFARAYQQTHDWRTVR